MEVDCPYCEKELDIDSSESSVYDEGVKHQHECPHCEKSFVFETYVSFHFEPAKADCLNDGKHDYQMTATTPIEYSEMECKMCGSSRELSDDERTKFNIGTKESYFEKMYQFYEKNDHGLNGKVAQTYLQRQNICYTK